MPVLQEEVHRWIFVASVEAPPTQDKRDLNDGGRLCRDSASRTIEPGRYQA